VKPIKYLFILCILTIFLNGCASFSEAGKVLRNEKKSTTDEFLIKKKQPLTLPPGAETLPVPGSIDNKVENQQNSIEKILRTQQTQSGSSKSKSSSAEESILSKIKK